MFSDTVFSITMPRKGNKCAQVYGTNFDWARVHTMASRSERHETLPLLFVRNNVLPTHRYDNAKEMIQGKFYEKLKDAACQLKQLESYTPFTNDAE